ncbi:MAG: HAMP domain-containing histidine kinase [Oscillospiraceae bacterium]|nr:HAMP domain-containing histidine kinase [Oscillospiraceae bacterium]
MPRSGKTTTAVKLISVVCSIIFLWAAGVSMLCVLVNLAVGFADSGTDFNQAFLALTKDHDVNDIRSYATLSLRLQNDNFRPRDAEHQAMIQNLINSYQTQFDPERTNLRFAVTDLDGKLLLTNDPDYDARQKRLASDVATENLLITDQSYQKNQHFESSAEAFRTLLHTDMQQFLTDAEDYKYWFFTNDLVDAAYHNGFTAEVQNGEYTDFLFFPSLHDAQEYNYREYYGDAVKWQQIANPDDEIKSTAHEPYAGYDDDSSIQSAGRTEAGTEPVYVKVRAFAESEETDMSLDQYFVLKESGMTVRAQDENLERALAGGLDVTITASHQESEAVYLQTYLPEDLPVNDTIRANHQLFRVLFDRSEWFVVSMFLFIILTIIASISMCTAAGHRDSHETLAPSRVHAMAYEFFWLLPPLALVVSSLAMSLLVHEDASYRMVGLFGLGLSLCISLCCILWLYTTAVRVKCGTFWSSFFFVRIARKLFALFRNRTLVSIIAAVSLGFLCIVNAAALECINTPLILPIFGIDLLALLILLYCIYAYFELHSHVRRMETGDFTPAKHALPLSGDFSRFDSSLNEITGKVGEIVAQQTKAEHLRTELITNVSHDLKTPLTSIVNYVDLLSRQQMPTPEATEYLEVLRRQAARLKKLTIDLVDASKASTGNLTVELMPTVLQVLIEQLSGEYEDRFAERRLSLICNLPTEPLVILADGRQIWRVFDNLLGNACKYALSGTRVYLDLTADAETVTISLKNISATELNISPDELMERFVRGDSSRHTEGSGLGLSIARDLTALQNGVLKLHTDGDLFKATLVFPRYEPENPPDGAEPPSPAS